MRKILGAATLLLSIVLIVLSTLIIIFAANYQQMLTKSNANQARNNDAFAAAEAGLEYGIAYLQKNSAIILAAPSNGYIQNYTSANTTNVALSNGSSYSIVYTNPTANNYNVIKITATGTNADGTSTRVISQLVGLNGFLSSLPTSPINSKAPVSMSGNASVINMEANKTITSSGSISFSGNSHTTTSSGSGTNGSDLSANNSALQNMSQSSFFSSYFGGSVSTVQAKASNFYSNSSNANYNGTLNGMVGTSIWIEQTGGTTATISGNTTIGSASQPVVLIVNGNLSLSGNVTIYGFVLIIGTTGISTLTGNTQIIGGLASTDTLNMAGNISITFNSTVLNALKSGSSTSTWVKVAGTWSDF